tara:strand:+ start:94 stop:300 length:207 start_codon:yes stop_codon:yes gene_type:complete
MKVGDLVKAKPGTVEGDPNSLGVGLITSIGNDHLGGLICYVSWSKTKGQPWFMYQKDLITISKDVKKL